MRFRQVVVLFAALGLFVGTSAPMSAQTFVDVAQGFGTLNDAVDGDTTSTGERNNLDTVYRLERDGIYLLNGSIENSFPLTVVAADGEGARPRLIPGVPTGGSSGRPFRHRSPLRRKRREVAEWRAAAS